MKPARLPPPVRPGARVGVAALSGPVRPERLLAGLEALAALGFEPVPADNLESREGLFAGGDDERLAAFHRLAADPGLEAVFFARGGYGVTRLLHRIDWDLLARHPRAYVGYSDLTPFLLAVVERLGLAAFHGPMVAADLARGLAPQEERSLLDALGGDLPVRLPVGGWVRRGQARGVVAGGCLSLFAATLGTPAFPDLEGCLLVLEEIAEPPYRLDRMLTQLRLSGRLAGVRGIAFGHVDPPPEIPAGEWLTLCREALEALPGPVAFGLPSGHSAPNLTLPLGLPGHLDPQAGELRVGVS